ncbi:MAG: BatA domain-containing protein [Roseibacillus sp.]
MNFASILFLAGGAAVVIPLLIHLIRRRRWEQVSIGSLRFLQEAARTSRRMSQVDNWPLMLLRMLMLLLLAFVFARPYFSEKEKRESVDGGTILVLLDASGSLVESREEVIKLAEQATQGKEGVGVRLVAFADEVEELSKVDDYRAVAGSPTDWEGVVEWTIDAVAAGSVSEVVVVTDGRNGGVADEPQRLWPSSVAINIQRVQAKGEANAAVGEVELLTEYQGLETVFEARVEVEGDWSGEAVLELEDGRRASVVVPEGGGRVVFGVEPGELSESERLLRGKVTLKGQEADSWSADDVRYFALLERVRKRILILDGDPGATPFTSEGYYLSRALQASGRGPGQSAFVPVIQNDFRLAEPREGEERWDAIVLCNWAQVGSFEAEVLESWRELGTGLVVVLGDQSSAAGYASLTERGLFPKGLERQEVATPRPLELGEEESLAMRGFSEVGSGLNTLFLRDGFRFGDSGSWIESASLRGGGGLLFEKVEEGKGLALVVAHPLTREWGDFPISRWFVPLAMEWMKAATGWRESGARVLNSVVGFSRPEQGIFDQEGQVGVVNADVEERKVGVLSDSELRERLGVPSEDGSLELANTPVLSELPASRERPHEIWPWLLFVLILLGGYELWFSDFRKFKPQNI